VPEARDGRGAPPGRSTEPGPTEPGPTEPGPTGPGAVGAQGSVVLVGTPIGNLGDLSPRAVAALGSAEIVYCEDTRRTRALLAHAGITGARLRSLHQHNEHASVDRIVEEVGSGLRVALVSDAGMPGVSDPGRQVVAAVRAAGLAVSVVPGPSAAIAALVVSGMVTDRFCFEGFLPRSGAARRARIGRVVAEDRTVVLFEAPGRVAATLADLAAACGPERRVAVARELTKLHEEVWDGTLAQAVQWAGAGSLRGEVVLVLEGAAGTPRADPDDAEVEAALARRLEAGERTRGAVDAVAAELGVARRRVYQLAVAPGMRPSPPRL
jgi:16S rRNA (cytidine1402-2'-O)-methyltransferase